VGSVPKALSPAPRPPGPVPRLRPQVSVPRGQAPKDQVRFDGLELGLYPPALPQGAEQEYSVHFRPRRKRLTIY